MEEPESGGKIFVCNFSFRGELRDTYQNWDNVT